AECPSNVNLSLLKAELLYGRIQADGLKLRQWLVSSVDTFGRLGCKMPRLANTIAQSLVMRSLLSKTIGLAWQRPVPSYARQRFDKWFWRRRRLAAPTRGRVILWDDTFVRYYEPHIGIAAVKVLEALGFDVSLVKNRRCCGRPAFSQGNLDAAAKGGKRNISQLSTLTHELSAAPILFLEPSCWS